jgi:hypothetical protein
VLLGARRRRRVLPVRCRSLHRRIATLAVRRCARRWEYRFMGSGTGRSSPLTHPGPAGSAPCRSRPLPVGAE